MIPFLYIWAAIALAFLIIGWKLTARPHGQQRRSTTRTAYCYGCGFTNEPLFLCRFQDGRAQVTACVCLSCAHRYDVQEVE